MKGFEKKLSDPAVLTKSGDAAVQGQASLKMPQRYL